MVWTSLEAVLQETALFISTALLLSACLLLATASNGWPDKADLWHEPQDLLMSS